MFDLNNSKLHPFYQGFWKNQDVRVITLKNEKLSQIVWQWVGRIPSDGFIYGDLSLLNNKDGNYTFIYPDLKTGLQVRIKGKI